MNSGHNVANIIQENIDIIFDNMLYICTNNYSTIIL